MRRVLLLLLTIANLFCGVSYAAPLNLAQSPLFFTESVAPMTMLVLGRDHKFYFEAYDDFTDLDGDGAIEYTFKPSFTYFGYFDSNKCYAYDTGGNLFYPTSIASNKKCPGSWSGNFLNYLTTARFDAVRKVLYGGFRSVDTTSQTVLQRIYVPLDGHSWAKEHELTHGYNISDYTPYTPPTSSTVRHIFYSGSLNKNGYPMLRVALNQPYTIWQWLDLEFKGNAAAVPGVTDFAVQVKVCDPNVGLEPNCRAYPNGNYKPIGLLQEYGENDSMLFGLITGSYANNTNGGVLRKNIGSIRDEINLTTGQFTAVNGIISTINKFTFTHPNTNLYVCAYKNLTSGSCEMLGEPIAEMIYEAVRYFAGKSGPTAGFNYSGGRDNSLNLPNASWQNPYTNFPSCAKANILSISDFYPTYDSDYVPGNYFNPMSGDLASLNVSALAQAIFNGEGFSSLFAFIGESGTNADGNPTAKPVTSFANIRGLAPYDTAYEGSYYAASVAYHGWLNDLSNVAGTQNAKLFSVVLSPRRPEINFKVGNSSVSIIPFGKSVSGSQINENGGNNVPTSAVVDIYVDYLINNQGIFTVNFSDLQAGSGFGIDTIVRYTITVNANNTLTITTESLFANSGKKQHLGYIISGTTKDGIYLEVRDKDTGSNQDVDYILDTPPGAFPGGTWNDNQPLPWITNRTLTASGLGPAKTFNSPLWYAAKWGGFTDSNNNKVPDIQSEYDTSNSGNPDNFFLITNASNLGAQLSKALQAIMDRSGSFSSATLSSGSLKSGTLIYQAIFRTIDWSGRLLAFALDPDNGNILYTGSSTQGAIWDAAEKLKLQNFNTGRNIITYKPSTKKGIPFRWPTNPASPTLTELDVSQSTILNTNPSTALVDNQGSNRLNYIRGDRSKEMQNGGIFRNRSTPLGDIIDSGPVLVDVPKQNYPIVWSGSAAENTVPYSTFRDANLNRKPVIYVGANDGMLHAFDADNGNELFAYVPSKVFANLNQLTSTSYSHRYYVDGSPNAIDVFINGNWRTVLVGSLNAGGQGIFALDITDPTMFAESNAEQLVKWEFSDVNDADMGFSFGQASIVRLANGQWAAIFGNGYNNTYSDSNVSSTGNAVIYVVNIDTGAIIKKFDTKVGMSSDPLNLARPNGMSSPTVVDTDGNMIADLIYAGDLFGNVWKIDISSANPSLWDFSFKNGSGNPAPFFVAKDSTGKRQPITTRPTVSRVNFSTGGLQIYIGTGKYIENADKTDLSIQSIYALRDDTNTVITGREQLLQQTIIAEQTNLRITSDNAITNQRGWYMDLIYNGQAQGERTISDMIYLNGRIIFTTVIPNTDPCDYGGTSWLMELNANTGGRLNFNVFDLNQDGQFNSADGVTITTQDGQQLSTTASGLKSEVGLTATPAILNAGSKEYKYLAGTSGSMQKVNENPGQQAYGRQSWRQLQ
ncbi:pilus assembly protein [Legionella gresilensis]|uniref:pilus assembly protein n=1 Tax=Legionella gresilensis TaxID=91823 RepID=UPI001041B19A|nr:PilC/PilY family type IV pilus protein [Legionella gresilensis]